MRTRFFASLYVVTFSTFLLARLFADSGTSPTIAISNSLFIQDNASLTDPVAAALALPGDQSGFARGFSDYSPYTPAQLADQGIIEQEYNGTGIYMKVRDINDSPLIGADKYVKAISYAIITAKSDQKKPVTDDSLYPVNMDESSYKATLRGDTAYIKIDLVANTLANDDYIVIRITLLDDSHWYEVLQERQAGFATPNSKDWIKLFEFPALTFTNFTAYFDRHEAVTLAAAMPGVSASYQLVRFFFARSHAYLTLSPFLSLDVSAIPALRGATIGTSGSANEGFFQFLSSFVGGGAVGVVTNGVTYYIGYGWAPHFNTDYSWSNLDGGLVVGADLLNVAGDLATLLGGNSKPKS